MALQGGIVLEFSITGAETTYGIVQNATVTEQTERATARGELGATVSTQEFDPTYSLSLNYLVLGTPVSKPAVGTAFTYDSIVYQIDSTADGTTIDGFATVDISATSYPDATIA